MFESWPEMWGGGNPAYRTTLRKFLWFRTVTGGNAPKYETVTGRIVSFITRRAAPLKIEATLTPIQSLNGQDAPYPPGGGKNKLPYFADRTSADVTFTVSENGIISISGTATGTANCYLAGRTQSTSESKFDLPNGEYILSGGYSNNIYIVLLDGDSTGTRYDCKGFPVNVTITQGYATVRIVVLSGTVTDGVVLYPMLRLATEQDATYAPYSNECPISGHTGAEIVRDGKNLFDSNWWNVSGTGTSITKGTGSVKIVNTSGTRYAGCNALAADGLMNTDQLPTSKGGKYTISFDLSGTLTATWIIGLRRKRDNVFHSTYRVSTSETGHYSFTFDMDTLTDNYYISASRTGNSTADLDVTISNFQIEVGETETAYEPYSGTTVTVSFGQTVYGGTLTVNEDGTGSVVATMASVTLTGATQITGFSPSADYGSYGQLASGAEVNNGSIMCISNMAQGISFDNRIGASYRTKDRCYVDNNGNVTLRASSEREITTATDLFNVFNGCMIVYSLATPITIQLTPGQVEALQGNNTVWIDDSSEIKVTYRSN